MESLTAFVALWALLLVLLTIDRIRAGPSWRARFAFLMVPIAGIATLFATDYPSNRLCELAVLALPPMAGAYLLLGWLPHRGGKPRTAGAQALVLLLMAALSAYPTVKFLS
jgi:hypothetical protein